MSLPLYYSNIDLYLKDVLQFLKEYEWIYTTSNTEFICAGTLNQIPSDWITTVDTISLEELNIIPFDYINETWPDSLRKFLVTIKSLKPIRVEGPMTSSEHDKHDMQFLRGIKPKKVHEIHQLSNEISQNCGTLTDVIIIDLGCGIGHLTNYLHRKFQYKVLGIEADLERVQTAEKIQRDKFPESINSVKFVQHFIEPSSAAFIQALLMKEFNANNSSNIILIGLHACADLSITALNLFLRVANIKKVFIMPCCYHKMKYKMNSCNEFENVPLSQRVKFAEHSKDIINRPFLRLAGQQTSARWRNVTENEHNEHGRNMFIRGVVQAVLSEDEMVVKNKNMKTDDDSELNYYTLLNRQTKKEKIWSDSQKLAFMNLLNEHPNGGNVSEFLTCLQTSIQSICENFVFLDRLLYVKEAAEELQLKVTISVKKIVMDEISPRCFVINAEKN